MANNPIFHSQYTAQQIENEITNGVPKIVDGYWWRWDIATGTWVNTGDSAEGAEAWHGIAEEFSTSADYAVGDLCIYNGELYVCTTAHSGAWNAGNFAVTTVDAQKASWEVALGAYPTESSSGATAETDVGADGIPLKTLVADIVAVQDGEGTPSFDNVRDISGFEGLTITHGEDEIPISWSSVAGEVYGGTLDVLTGKLTVTHRRITRDGTQTIAASTVSQRTNTTRFAIYTGASDSSRCPNPSEVDLSLAICDKVPSVANVYNNDLLGLYIPINQSASAYAQYGGVIYVSIPSAAGSTADSVKAWLAENPIEIVYKLDVPTVYQLTANEVKSVLGQNSISASTGDVSVTYRCDPVLYIAKQISAAIEAIGG